MERTIRVTGKGKISVKPDTMRLIITQSAVEKEYEDSIKSSAAEKEYINEKIQNIGFKKDDLKTLSFNIDKETEGYRDKNGDWKRIFKGYKYVHVMKLEFPSDNERLGKLLSIISKCPGSPEFSIHYTISDTESAKTELLARAVEDSKKKAIVLSKAAGVSLLDIISIDYSWREIDFVTSPVDRMMAEEYCEAECCEKEMTLDIEADDIDVTDTVTVVWKIE